MPRLLLDPGSRGASHDPPPSPRLYPMQGCLRTTGPLRLPPTLRLGQATNSEPLSKVETRSRERAAVRLRALHKRPSIRLRTNASTSRKIINEGFTMKLFPDRSQIGGHLLRLALDAVLR